MAADSAPLRVAIAQIDTTVGDIAGNTGKVAEQIARAREARAALVVFPELAVTGYPPEDLLLKTHFLEAARAAVEDLAKGTRGIVALVGFPERSDDVYNAAAVLAEGRVAAVYRKIHLPNYSVFDEERYFQAGDSPALVSIDGVRVGITICEDIWEPGPPATAEALAGAEVLVNLSASPYHAGKGIERERMLIQRARDNLFVMVFCNLVGSEEELAPELASLSLERAPADPVGGEVAELLEPEEEVYAALCTGLRDYVEKNGFEHVVLALSGGIDSSLTATVAVDALGSERVTAVAMPSPFSSEGTRRDARELAANLGLELLEIPIEDAMRGYDQMLGDVFAGREPDIAEENIQARIRGNLVMALSNKFGWLVLTTGNKSELSVGYATLYGDMAGGFAVLKDVFKGWVYRLARWRNRRSDPPPIPQGVLERPPSAELRYEQRDEDSLPPYEVLDGILAGYVEEDLDAGELVARGFQPEEFERVIRMVDRAEYKRRQAPPGIRISTKAFGRDRRLPITNRYESRVPDQAAERRLRALS